VTRQWVSERKRAATVAPVTPNERSSRRAIFGVAAASPPL
jgi:hypothetical protein